MGRYSRALETYKRALELCKKSQDRHRIKKKLKKARDLLSDMPDL